jgi:8-oxo-dGTP pyrophosphatase MutT (NUDIX family)
MITRPLFKLAYRLNRLRWRLTKPLKIGVRVMLIEDGAVWLVRHTYLDGWYFPGGGVQRGETLEGAARREAAEEVGATMGELTLAGAYTGLTEGKSDHIVVFRCVDFELTGKSDAEIARCARFPLDRLPEDTSLGTRRRVDEYLAGKLPAFGEW